MITEQFHNWGQYVKEASLDLESIDSTDLLQYPIQYLQDALIGIQKSELVVIGASTGIGKTELANSIAFVNARRGHDVYLFSLEGDRYEVVQRERYRRVAKMYYEDGRNDIDMSYRQFIFNCYGNKLDKYLSVVDPQIREDYKYLHLYKRTEAMTADMLEAQLELISGDIDLVIIDHLHYFSFISSNEHAEITAIMKKIHQLKTRHRIPIVLVSHLRKKEKGQVFPDNNDFHGSSNIAKQADTCIILAPAVIAQEGEDIVDVHKQEIGSNIYSTGIRITKTRTGLSQKLLGIVDYNLTLRSYAKEYKMALCLERGVYNLEKNPKWAKGATNEPRPDKVSQRPQSYIDKSYQS